MSSSTLTFTVPALTPKSPRGFGLSALRRVFLLAVTASLFGCAHMKAAPGGYLSSYEQLSPADEAAPSRSFVRPATQLDASQIEFSQVEWAGQGPSALTAQEQQQLVSHLREQLSLGLAELGGAQMSTAAKVAPHAKPTLLLRAGVTRAEVVSPTLNAVSTLVLFVPLDRGGAAVEIELLDAQTRQPVAALLSAHYAPLSEFKARFERLAPAEYAVRQAALEFVEMLRAAQ